MRIASIVAAAAALVFPLHATADDKKPSDAEITRLLVGKWHGADPTTGVSGTITYAKDGTFVGEGSVPLTDTQKVEFRAEGTWKVADGAIHFKVTKSTRPGVVPVDIEVKEVVLGIDEKSVRYRRGLGKEKVRTRVTE